MSTTRPVARPDQLVDVREAAVLPPVEVVDTLAGLAVMQPKASKSFAKFKPEQTFARRKALDAAAKYAALIGDTDSLQKAVALKMFEEAGFAAQVKALFPQGAPVGNKRAARNRVAPEGHSVSAEDYCEQFGFKFRTVRKWYKLIDDEVREAETAKRVQRVQALVLGESAVHVAQNTGENEWYTPAEFIEAAREVMGSIDLHPASTAIANEVVGATRFFTIAENGLAQPWAETVFLNPPYSQPLIGQFAAKLAAEVGAGRVKQAIVLVNNAMETDWFGTIVACAAAVCFPRGRVKFWYHERESAQPLQGQAVLYVGSALARFAAAFGPFGHVLAPLDAPKVEVVS